MLFVEQAEREDGDEGQDQDRRPRPDQLDGGVVAEPRRLGVGLLVEAHDHDQQEPEHQQGDGRDDRQQDVVVEADHIGADLRSLRLEADSLGDGLADDLIGPGER